MRIILILIATVMITACNNFNPFLEEDLLKRPKAKRCADCHKKIYDQWKDSRHFHSWNSETFKRSSQNYSKVKCLSCHAPYEIKVGEKPELRNFHREDGINCASCHFKDETKSMHGPYKVFSPPHPSKQDLTYTKSEICSGCHQETYKEWKKTGSENSCQSCHMPSKKDKIIQKFPFDLFHSKKDLHNHSFPVLKASEKDLEIKISKEDESTILVTITNKTVPHNLPTADQGKPKFYVTVEFYKDDNKIDEDSQLILHKGDEAFVYQKPKTLEFTTFEEYNSISIKIERKLSWKKKRELIFFKKVRRDEIRDSGL